MLLDSSALFLQTARFTGPVAITTTERTRGIIVILQRLVQELPRFGPLPGGEEVFGQQASMPQRRRQLDQVPASLQRGLFVALLFIRLDERAPSGVIRPGAIPTNNALQKRHSLVWLAELFVTNSERIHNLAMFRFHRVSFFQMGQGARVVFLLD